MRGGFVTESTRSEVHANPYSVLLIGKNIDVVISAADCSELVGRHRFQNPQRLDPPRRIVKQLMFDPHFSSATDAERDVPHDIVHDFIHSRRNLFALRVRQNGEVSAGNIEADTAQRNFVPIGNYSADGLGITFVSIGAKHRALATSRDARFDLFDRRLVVLAKNLRSYLHRNNLCPVKTISNGYRRSDFFAIIRQAWTSVRFRTGSVIRTAAIESKRTSRNGSLIVLASSRSVAAEILRL